MYLKEVHGLLESEAYLRRMLPENLCRKVGYAPQGNADAVRFIIEFSQRKVVYDAWRKRRRINRALRARMRGSVPAEEFYASLSWKKARYQALARSAGKCECCGATGDKSPLHVDHIKPRSKYPDLALEITNLQVLCADCNIGKLNTDETDWRKPVLKIVA